MIILNLEEARKSIDEIDFEILDFLSRRKNIIKSISILKKENQLPIFDESREKSIIDRIKEK